MKKYIFSLALSLFLLCACAVKTEAQTVMTNPNGLSIDTISNTTAEAAYLQVKGYQSAVSIVTNVIKLTGTIGGTIAWQGSNDGISYYTISSDTLTNASNVYGFSESPKRYLYYRSLLTGNNTGTASYHSVLYTTKP